jgi:hypothetical protein
VQTLDVLAALRRDHEEVRRRLLDRTAGPAPVKEAVARLAEVCVPHFELEEKTIYAALELLHRVATAGDVQPEVAERLKQVAKFSRQQRFFGAEHRCILPAVDALFAAADKEGDARLVEVAELLWKHEKTEEEFDLPAHGLASLTRLAL